MAAAMSSVNRQNLDGVLVAALHGSKGPPPASAIEGLLRLAGAQHNTGATATLLREVARTPDGKFAAWQYAALGALLDALDNQGSSLTQLSRKDEALAAAVKNVTEVFAAARRLVADPAARPSERVQAARLLGRGLDHQVEDATLLAGLLVPQTPDEVQSAAVAGLGRLRDERVPQLLLAGWKGYGPALRHSGAGGPVPARRVAADDP